MSEDTNGVAAEEKKVKFAEKEFDVVTGVASFRFGNGEAISLNVYELDETIQKQLMGHGMLQKGGDSYAGAKGDYAAAVDSLGSVIDALQNGRWTQEREGVGGPRIGELAEAVAQFKGWELDKATETVRAMPEENLKKLRAAPQIKALIAKMRFEKAQKDAAAAAASGSLDAIL